MAVENVIIVGSGPAGLTAAIYTSRALLKPLLFEGEMPGGQLTTTTEVENYPGFEKGIMGPELVQVMRNQAERFGTQILTKNVTKVDFSQRPFKIWSSQEQYQAHSVIIATGESSQSLGLDSEKKYAARGVSYCATCDGAFFKNVPIAIVGGGDSAVEEALFLTRFASKVYIIHRRHELRASKIMADRALKHPKIEMLWNKAVDEIMGNTVVQALRIKDIETGKKSELKVDGLFVAIGHKPNSDIFRGQIALDEKGYIATRPNSSYTSVDGVFACGDVQDHVYRQAVTAAGSGCMAAIDAERWLEKQE